jgi:hypothetical protein
MQNAEFAQNQTILIQMIEDSECTTMFIRRIEIIRIQPRAAPK